MGSQKSTPTWMSLKALRTGSLPPAISHQCHGPCDRGTKVSIDAARRFRWLLQARNRMCRFESAAAAFGGRRAACRVSVI